MINRTNGTPITITNNSQTTIPGPLALKLRYPTQNLSNKSFVDSCVSNNSNANIYNSNAYIYPDGNNSGDLAPGASLTFTPKFDGASGSYYVELALVRVGKVNGSDPAKVDLTGTRTSLPADAAITIYGPPGTSFTATPSIQSSTPNWISFNSLSSSSKFDQFGMAIFRYTLNRPVLAADQLNATEIALLKVTSGNPVVETNVWVTLHLRTADSFTLTSSWFPEVPLGQTIDFKIVASYVPVIIDDGASRITGTVTLNEISGQSSTVLATGYLNNHSDTNPQPDNTVLFPGLTLSPGIHKLQASYAGDSFYAANVSPLITLSVGRPTLKLSTNPSNLLVSLDGTGYKGPSVLGLAYLSTHTLNPVTPQNAPGARFVFSGWADAGAIRSRTITLDQSSAEYTANYDAEYQLTTTVSDPAAGTIAVTPANGDGFYPANALVSLTAKPNPGFTFKGFDLVPIGNPVTVAMNGPVKITAFFEQQPQQPPITAAALAINTTFVRNAAAGLIQVTVVLTNTGSSVVNGVQLTLARIASTTGTPVPQSLGAIPPGGSATAVVAFAASVGAAGASSSLALAGSYSGGTFSRASRIVLP